MKGQTVMVAVGVGIVVMVGITLFLYLISTGGQDIGAYVLVMISMILVLGAVYMIWDNIKNIQAGLPLKDERMIQVSYRAGYYGFIAAIWSAVGSNSLSIFILDEDLRGGLVVAAVVLVSGLVFIVSYLYLSMKGGAE